MQFLDEAVPYPGFICGQLRAPSALRPAQFVSGHVIRVCLPVALPVVRVSLCPRHFFWRITFAMPRIQAAPAPKVLPFASELAIWAAATLLDESSWVLPVIPAAIRTPFSLHGGRVLLPEGCFYGGSDSRVDSSAAKTGHDHRRAKLYINDRRFLDILQTALTYRPCRPGALFG